MTELRRIGKAKIGRIPITALAALAVLLSTGGCGEKTGQPESKRAYSTIVIEVVDLYSKLHPLRSSRLGLCQSDSLMLTFSMQEMDDFTEAIEELLGDVTSLPVAGLGQRDIDNSNLTLHWLKGELFALERIQNYRRNPLLYCWMLEEALFGMPSRIQPPYEGELSAYERRISAIPELLGNAAELLENPAELHTRFAFERLNTLLSDFEELERLIRERYGEQAATLDPAWRSIENFRAFIADDLLSRSHGSIIIGTENLSRVFQYDDLIELDPNTMIEEADKIIIKSKIQATSIRKELARPDRVPGKNWRDEPGTDENGTGTPGTGESKHEETTSAKGKSLESRVRMLMDKIDKETKEQNLLGRGMGEHIDIINGKPPRYLDELPANPYLTIPPVEEKEMTLASIPRFCGLPYQSYVVISKSDDGFEEPELTYTLLGVSLPIGELNHRICSEGDTLRALLTSGTHMAGWTIHNMDALLEIFPENKLELELTMTEKKILDLARMIVVLRLHAGTLTSEAAARYLVETAERGEDEARFDVLQASVSPSIAYPGIAIILTDQIAKRYSYARRIKNPRTEVRRLFLEHPGLPLSMIMIRVPAD